MTDSQTLMAEAILGKDAEDFLKSEVGQYIVGRIEQDIEEAKSKFTEVDPTDAKAVMSLQNEIKRAESLKQYFEEIIVAGRNAFNLLKGEEDN